MDKKYQDLHICNNRNCDVSIMRGITIKQITFTETMIFIEYNVGTIPLAMTLNKKDISITID